MSQSFELKINPPLQMLVSVLLIYAIAQLLPVSASLLELKWLIGGASVVVGLFFNIAAGVSFRSANTTGNPQRPGMASSLVTSGVYRITRNPMYVGLLFFLLAWTAWLGSLFGLTVIAAFQQYITRFQIIPEEQALAGLFPESFRNYSNQVRRWL